PAGSPDSRHAGSVSRVRMAAAALAASGVVLAGCGGEAPDSTGGGSVPLPEATPAVPDDAPGVPGSPSAGPDGARSGPDGAPALPEVSDPGDGTHAASIAAVDEAARTVTVDLVDVGEDATEPLTLPVADDVQVTVLWLGGGGAEAELIG